MQDRVATQDKATVAGLDAINKATDTALGNLFRQDTTLTFGVPPLCRPPGPSVVSQEKASFQKASLGAQHLPPRKNRRRIGPPLPAGDSRLGLLLAQEQDSPSGRGKFPRFAAPHRSSASRWATSLLIALLATWFLYPMPPRLFSALAGAAALIPAVIVIRSTDRSGELLHSLRHGHRLISSTRCGMS